MPEQTTPIHRVLLSVEDSAKKRVFKSGTGNSTERHTIGAKRSTAHSVIDTDKTTLRPSECWSGSQSGHGLDVKLGRHGGGDWSSSAPYIVQKRLPRVDQDRLLPPSQGFQADEKIRSKSMPSIDQVKPEPREDSLDIIHKNPQNTLRLLSPPTWSATIRTRKLMEDGYVELPKAVVEHEETKRLLSAQKKFLREQGRHEKGKYRERDSREEINSRNTRDHEQPTKEARIHSKKHKSMSRQSMLQSQDREASLKTMTKNDNAMEFPIQDRSIKIEVDLQNDASISEILSNNQDNKMGSRIRRQNDSDPRREDCTCQMLPQFFRTHWRFIPGTAWSGSKFEFLEHLKQISTCVGHPHAVRKYCQRTLKSANYPESLGLWSAMDFAQEASSAASNCAARSQKRQLDVDTVHRLTLLSTTNKTSQDARSDPDCGTLQGNEIKRRKVMSSKAHPAHATPNSISPQLVAAEPRSQSVTMSPRSQRTSTKLPFPLAPLVKTPEVSSKIHFLNDSTRQGLECKGDETASASNAMTPLGSYSQPISTNKKRHQSVPPFSSQEVIHNLEYISRFPKTREPHWEAALPALSTNTIFSGNAFKELAQAVKRLESMLLPTAAANQDAFNEPTAVVSATNTQSESSQSLRKKRKTVAERKATDQPELDRNVPPHLRQPDDVLIDIGRNVNGYRRHTKAPEAFNWHGRLYSEYDYLLTQLDEYGNPMWDCKEIARLKR